LPKFAHLLSTVRARTTPLGVDTSAKRKRASVCRSLRNQSVGDHHFVRKKAPWHFAFGKAGAAAREPKQDIAPLVPRPPAARQPSPNIESVPLSVTTQNALPTPPSVEGKLTIEEITA